MRRKERLRWLRDLKRAERRGDKFIVGKEWQRIVSKYLKLVTK